MPKAIFHLAFPVHDLRQAEIFYVKGLGCRPGRRSGHSLILNLHGHQIVAQAMEKGSGEPPQKGIYPRHFGLIFARHSDWKKMESRARRKGLLFFQEPRIRYPGTPIEHYTFFLKDPSNNLLEFKYYVKVLAIFGRKSFKKVGDEPPPL